MLDLALAGEDPSLARDALADARKQGLDETQLRALVEDCGRAHTKAKVSMVLFGEEDPHAI